MTVADLIRKTGLSQLELADLMCVSTSIITMLIKGRSTSARICSAIDELANVPTGTTLAAVRLTRECRRQQRKSQLLASRGITVDADGKIQKKEQES